MMVDLEKGKYVIAEWRISIYGKSQDEWKKLAQWIVKNKLVSTHVAWMV